MYGRSACNDKREAQLESEIERKRRAAMLRFETSCSASTNFCAKLESFLSGTCNRVFHSPVHLAVGIYENGNRGSPPRAASCSCLFTSRRKRGQQFSGHFGSPCPLSQQDRRPPLGRNPVPLPPLGYHSSRSTDFERHCQARTVRVLWTPKFNDRAESGQISHEERLRTICP